MNDIKSENNPNKWFIRREKMLKGPFSSAKIRHFIIEEQLLLTDEVSLDRAHWKLISSVPEVVPVSMRTGGDNDEEDKRLRSEQNQNDKKKSWFTIVILIVLLTSVVFLVTKSPQVNEEVLSDCSAPAKVGVNWHACRKLNYQLPSVNLSLADLSSIEMLNVNLSESNLQKTNLKYADLSAANLAYADLTEADLTGANLAGADLTNANFTAANLSHVDLTGVQLGGAVFTKAKLSGAIWLDGTRCAVSSIGKCVK